MQTPQVSSLSSVAFGSRTLQDAHQTSNLVGLWLTSVLIVAQAQQRRLSEEIGCHSIRVTSF
jgi:hypothetical protein